MDLSETPDTRLYERFENPKDLKDAESESQYSTQETREREEEEVLTARIVHYHEAPEWLQDNDFLLRGYRVNYHNPIDLLKSLFQAHHETLNVWTHLIGGLIFIFLFVKVVIYFDLSKKIYHLLIEKFKSSSNVMKEVTESMNKEIKPMFNQIKQKMGNNSLPEFEALAVKYKALTVTYAAVVSKTTHLQTDLGKKSLELYNKFYVLLIQVKKMAIHLTMKRKDKLQLSHTEHLLNLLGFANVINNLQTWPMLMFFATTAFCLGSSAIFHWVYVKNERILKIFYRLDLAGISGLIWGSVSSIIYYTYYCKPFWFNLYFGLISLFSTCVFVISMQDWVYAKSKRTFRGVMYLVLGIASTSSIFHGFIQQTFWDDWIFPYNKIIWYIATTIACLAVGCLFYVFRIPERFKPGYFDYWFNSHTIWHSFVLAAVLVHHFGLKQAYEARAQLKCVA